jgi:hypothetical protein
MRGVWTFGWPSSNGWRVLQTLYLQCVCRATIERKFNQSKRSFDGGMIMARKIVQTENIQLAEYTLLQLTLYDDGNVTVGVWKDNGDDKEQSIVELDVPKGLFFKATLRLIEEDQ